MESTQGLDILSSETSYHQMSRNLEVTRLGVNTLRPRQNGRHFPDDIFKWVFWNENVWISINISLKFVPRGLINNIPTLVHVMAWRRPGNKPLSELMMVRLPTHTCVTRPQCVNVTIPTGTRRNNNAIMMSKRRTEVILTSWWRNCGVICQLRHHTNIWQAYRHLSCIACQILESSDNSPGKSTTLRGGTC